MNKKDLRSYYKAKRSSLSPYQHAKLSSQALEYLINWPIYQQAQKIMSFVSFKDEINSQEIINHALQDGKNLYVPISLKKERKLLASQIYSLSNLEEDFYGVPSPREKNIIPEDKNNLDLIIIPGLAFDRSGGRLGFGGGYYDSFLAGLDPSIIKLGLAFSFQISQEALPQEDHDQLLDYILSDQGIIRCEDK